MRMWWSLPPDFFQSHCVLVQKTFPSILREQLSPGLEQAGTEPGQPSVTGPSPGQLRRATQHPSFRHFDFGENLV